ncbi:MAG TPA: efflux RND transporter periplasmic adaptor subunit [Gemmatimonadales bacterium]|jgi:HlyD family secretion protein
MAMRYTAILLLLLAACGKSKAPPALLYQAVPVERRDIVVSARASGTIQPDTTVEVKSQASGEILKVRVETGQVIKSGDLMIQIDPRIPRNNVDQAQSNLEVAQARLANAKTQLDRSQALLQSQSITQAEYDQSALDYATAKAGVVTARVALQNAQITLAQTDVRAPITGTIIEMDVERGQIISSPITTVGEGTVLLKMADLNRVQVSALVDETDIGKIQPGLPTSVTVDAYPNHPFDGSVIKIEPQATIQQNVTMFPVLIRIQNREGLLKPGMNTDVEIHVGRRDSVLAIPNSALRTSKDVGSAADVLGLSASEVQAQLAMADTAAGTPASGALPARPDSGGAAQRAGGGREITLPNGRTVTLPAGISEEQVRAIFQKRTSGQEVSEAERAILRRVFQGMAGGARSGGSTGGDGAGNGARRGGGAGSGSGGRYIVFVRRNGKPVAVNIRTGLTDLDYSEVLSGLTEQDSVLILPSASLVQAQKEFTQRVQRVTGGGIPGMSSQTQSGTKAPAATTTRP